MKTVTKFVFERETPGAVRFQEVDSNGKALKRDDEGMCIGTLYLRKSALKGKIPQVLTVTCES